MLNQGPKLSYGELKPLLLEVYCGKYDTFRHYLKSNKITVLDLSGPAQDKDDIKDLLSITYEIYYDHPEILRQTKNASITILTHPLLFKILYWILSEVDCNDRYGVEIYIRNKIKIQLFENLATALQGTAVTTIDMRRNRITNNNAYEFVKGLKGSAISTIDLTENWINDWIGDLKGLIPGTMLHTIFIDPHRAPDLTEALRLNQLLTAAPAQSWGFDIFAYLPQFRTTNQIATASSLINQEAAGSSPKPLLQF